MVGDDELAAAAVSVRTRMVQDMRKRSHSVVVAERKTKGNRDTWVLQMDCASLIEVQPSTACQNIQEETRRGD